MADKVSLVAAGFDPSFIDTLLKDFAADAPLVLQAIADLKAKGFGVAWIVDCFQTLGPAAFKFVTDLLALFGANTPVPIPPVVLAHPSMQATAGGRPFLDWIKANLPEILAFLLKILPLIPLQPAPATP